jgi:hypothetical protein
MIPIYRWDVYWNRRQETARKQMTHALEQSGTLHPVIQAALPSLTSDASLEAMAAATWAALVGFWRDVELDPALRYAIRDVVPFPHLGSVKLDAVGTIRFIKETACALGPDDRRCVELLAEIATDQEQANKLLKSMLQKAGAKDPRVTGFEQRFARTATRKVIESKLLQPAAARGRQAEAKTWSCAIFLAPLLLQRELNASKKSAVANSVSCASRKGDISTLHI